MPTVRIFRISLILLVLCSTYASAESVTLAWDPNPEPQVTGYKVYYGTSSRNYTQSVDAGNVTTFVVPNLDASKDYYFAVRAYDGDGGLSELSEEVKHTAPPVVLGTTKISAFTVNRLPPYAPGANVHWNTVATSTTGAVEYKFLMYSTTSGWSVAQDYSATSSLDWEPTFDDIGIHAIQVWARTVGSTAPYEAWVGGTFEVMSTPVRLVADMDFPAPPGQPIKWTATVAGANGPLEYRFLMLNRGTGVWSEMRPYGPSNEAIWTPATTGTFVMQVWARRIGSTAAYQVWGGTDVLTISPSPLSVSLSTNVSLPTATGIPMTWTARARGGTAGPIEYAFYRYSKEKNQWELARAYSPSPTFTWTPAWGEQGRYAMQVWARNAGSTAAFDAWRGTQYFEVVQPPVQLSTKTLFPVPPGTAVTWTTSVEGTATGLEYAYFVYSRSTGTWAVARAYSTSNTFVWTPSAVDAYIVQVWVRRVGSTAPYELWAGTGYLPVTVTPAKIVSLTSDVSLPATVGTPITWTAVGAGGTSAPLQYRFYLYTEGVGFKMLRDYSPSNTITWTPEAGDTGNHAIQVWVKSAYSLTSTYEGWMGTTMFVIKP